MHSAPYHGYGYVPLRFGGGGGGRPRGSAAQLYINNILETKVGNGRMHSAPYHGYGYVPLRFGGGGGGGGGGGDTFP